MSEYDFSQERWHAPRDTSVLEEVERIDPELLTSPETRQIVEVGAALIAGVTDMYGTPAAPKWCAGSREATVMLYHNGESAESHGHTSIGEGGAGVPRNALRIANTINMTAGREVMGAKARARVFAGASAHDIVQLCGRSIEVMQDNDATGERGDELESAQVAYDALYASDVPQEDCELVALNVLATTFDPKTGAQTIDYMQLPEVVLEQQVTACADLLGILLPRGPQGTIELIIEGFGLHAKNRILQAYMDDAGILPNQLSSPAALISFIDHTPELKENFIATLQAQTNFVENFTFSDSEIRKVCGKSIDELFPGRAQNVATLKNIAKQMTEGASLLAYWEQLTMNGAATPM